MLARDLHVGDSLHSNDWHLPIDAVDVQGNCVAVHVTSDFLLHYAADQVVEIDDPESSLLPLHPPAVAAGTPTPAGCAVPLLAGSTVMQGGGGAVLDLRGTAPHAEGGVS